MTSINRSDKISENQIKIDGLNINYKTIGDGGIPIVLLHGWGISSDKYLELTRWFHNSFGSVEPTCVQAPQPCGTMELTMFKILIPDLPGFGRSDEPKENWKLDDYVEFVDEFIEKTNRKGGFELVKNILEKMQITQARRRTNACSPSGLCLIGHSFGGQIAIKYAVKYPEKIDKLILTGAAGIRHKLTIKQKALFILTKIGKMAFSLPIISFFQNPIYKLFSKIARGRKKDYYSASSRMKEIMKNVLGEDLTDYFDKIKTPTLLIWGREDKITRLADGEIMKEKIRNSELIMVDNANHSLPYQKPKEFARIVGEFIKK